MTLLLADDIDISRGDLIAVAGNAPTVTDELDATLCWLAEKPLRPGARVLVKHGTRTVQAMVTELRDRFDEQNLSSVDSPASLELNEIGRVALRTAEPVPLDDYTFSRRTGSFLVIDASDGIHARGRTGRGSAAAAGRRAPCAEARLPRPRLPRSLKGPSP